MPGDENENKKTFRTVSIQVGPKTYEYADVAKQVDDIYLDTPTNNSNIIDIIGMYVNAQRVLYTEAKTVCEQRLSFLMLPSILFTVTSSIVTLILTENYGRIISSCLNGVIAFILALINYLKLDARAEAHRVSAYKYDKLVSYISFQSGKQLFFADACEEMDSIITSIEDTIKEIKETNPFVLPEIIRVKFPLLTSINVFTEVKKINNEEMILKNELTNIYTKKALCEHELKNTSPTNNTNDTNNTNVLRQELHSLLEQETKKIAEIIVLQKKYYQIDNNIQEELKKYSHQKSKRWFSCCEWLKV